MIPDGSCTRLLLLSGCCSLQDEFLRAWSLPPVSPTSNSSLMVVSLFLDGIFLPATAVLDLLDRLRAGYFDLVVILPPQLTGSLQLDPLGGSSQSAVVSRDHPGSAQVDPAVSAAKAVFSQWELCAWTAEQALAHSATNLFLWTVEQTGATQRSFSITTEFQKLGRFRDARREDSAVHQLTSVDSWPIARFLTDIPVVLSPTLGLHSSALGPECAFSHTSPTQVAFVPGPSFSPVQQFCSTLLLHANLSKELAPPLRDGVSGSDSVVSATWSLAQSPGSCATLYDCWLRGTLNSYVLANYTNESDIERYMGCTGAQRSSLLDLLDFSSSTGDIASSVFPLWFSGRSCVPVSPPRCVPHLGTASPYSVNEPYSHAGIGCKRSFSSKSFRRAKKTQKCCVTGRRTQRWDFTSMETQRLDFAPRRDGNPGRETSHQSLCDKLFESSLQLSGPSWTYGDWRWYGDNLSGHGDDYGYYDAFVCASAPGSVGAEGIRWQWRAFLVAFLWWSAGPSGRQVWF